MNYKSRIHQLIDLLSEYEASHLLNLFEQTIAGERYWERDVGIFYNDYVKAKYAATVDRAAVSTEITDSNSLFAPIPVVSSYTGLTSTPLPKSEPTHGTAHTIATRRSRRHYTAAPISLATIGNLLSIACGVTGTTRAYGYDELPLRPFPSCGGLQAPEVYASVQNSTDVPEGIYHYQPSEHALETIAVGSFGRRLAAAALEQPWVAQAAIVLLVTGRYDRLRWKYGERAYRFMCIDCGFLGQNIYLAAESLGLGACAIAGFLDDVVEHTFLIDGKDEMAMMLITIGHI